MSKAIIEVENLSKLYHLGETRPKSLRQAAEQWWNKLTGAKFQDHRDVPVSEFDASQKGPQPNTFWSLKDVSFKVSRGEVVGIIGHNGAGKSTLLKLLSRITEPTSGRAILRGRIASLLEVGTGFHPELTGRENVYLNGAILGMRRWEINRKFNDIVEFSGIEPFIDTPVKRYSSGMYVRLAFAVAAHLDPEILLIDEVLAMGDAGFQKKCMEKMGRMTHEGKTVLLISHNLGAVRQLSKRCVLLEKGKILLYDNTETVISGYLNMYTRSRHLEEHENYHRGDTVKFLNIKIPQGKNLLKQNTGLEFYAEIVSELNANNIRISATIFKSDGNPVGSFFSHEFDIRKNETTAFKIIFPNSGLVPGFYYTAWCISSGYPKKPKAFDYIAEGVSFEILSTQEDSSQNSVWQQSWGPIEFSQLSLEKVPINRDE